MAKPFFRQTTTWLGIAAFVSAAGGYFTGHMTVTQAVQAFITGLLGLAAGDSEPKK